MNDSVMRFLDDLNSVKPVDSSSANIERGLSMVDRALALITEASKPEEFQQTRILLNQKEPVLDVQAIRQSFTRGTAVLDSKEPLPPVRRIIQLTELKASLALLDERMDKAREVYSKLPAIAQGDFEKAGLARVMRHGAESMDVPGLAKLTEDIFPPFRTLCVIPEAMELMLKSLKTNVASMYLKTNLAITECFSVQTPGGAGGSL